MVLERVIRNAVLVIAIVLDLIIFGFIMFEAVIVL